MLKWATVYTMLKYNVCWYIVSFCNVGGQFYHCKLSDVELDNSAIDISSILIDQLNGTVREF